MAGAVSVTTGDDYKWHNNGNIVTEGQLGGKYIASEDNARHEIICQTAQKASAQQDWRERNDWEKEDIIGDSYNAWHGMGTESERVCGDSAKYGQKWLNKWKGVMAVPVLALKRKSLYYWAGHVTDKGVQWIWKVGGGHQQFR